MQPPLLFECGRFCGGNLKIKILIKVECKYHFFSKHSWWENNSECVSCEAELSCYVSAVRQGVNHESRQSGTKVSQQFCSSLSR